MRLTWRFMLRHPAHWLALGFGSGLSRLAPGTAGTLWAWAAWLVIERWLSATTMGALAVLAWPVGWWACSVTARHLRVADPGAIVWDEIAAFWLVLWLLLPAGFWMQLFAFGLFRLLDAAKPGPIGWCDRSFKGDAPDSPGNEPRWWQAGFGILLDDFAAAFCTLLVIAGVRAW